MKHLKKLIAAALTMFVAFAVSTVALADDGKITITNAALEESYSLYKVFDATVGSDGKIAYTLPEGKSVQGDTYFNKYFELKNGNVFIKKDANGNELFTEALLKKKDDNAAFRTWAKSFGTQIGQAVKATSTTVEWTNLDYGYYFVESTQGAIVTIDSTNPTASVIDKNSKLEFDKFIVLSNGDKVKVNEAGLNIPVDFDLTLTAMNYDGEDKIFEYVVYDTMDKGFSLTGAPVVKVGTQTLTAGTNGQYTISYTKNGVATETVTEADAFVINIPWTDNGAFDGNFLYSNDIALNVTYTAILDPAKAAQVTVGTTPNKNEADVKYYKGNDKPNTPSGDLPNPITETFATKITVKKVDGDKKPLTGAQFTLTSTNGTKVVYVTDYKFVEDAEGTYYKLNDGTFTEEEPDGTEVHDAAYASTTKKYKMTVENKVMSQGQADSSIAVYVGDDGKVSFTGLGVGDYKLEETVVPDGFNKADDIEFSISFDADTKKFASSNENVVLEGETNVFATTVVNNQGTELPSTGGIGTTIFYIVGGIMVVAAGVLLVTKKRVANN